MCAIVAILHYASSPERVDRDELLRMRDRMFSRGPDGAGEWYSPDGKVGLAHRRLAIIDLSDSATQPMIVVNAEGSRLKAKGPRSESFSAQPSPPFLQPFLCLVFNGEIYNYLELRSVLQEKGYIFQSTSDTEVLLHLYAEYGEAMVDQLRGMYAFALWDAQNSKLFLARDPFGIKPLYYSETGHTFRAASQVKALLSSKGIPTDIDPAGHAGFFLWGHVPEPYTLYRHIRSLNPGTTMTIDAQGHKTTRTFCRIENILSGSPTNEPAKSKTRWGDTPVEPLNLGTERLSTPFASSAAPSSKLQAPGSMLPAPRSMLLRNALLNSLKHHLIADVPVGLFLSSGIDSTTLTALASELHPRLRSVTLGFEEFRGTPEDEVPLAELVAKHYGTDHQTVWIKRADFDEHYDRLLSEMDQPTIDGVNTYFVSLAAARAGLKVALSGVGGDELFGGYPSFRQIPQSVRRLSWFGAIAGLGSLSRMISEPILSRTPPRNTPGCSNMAALTVGPTCCGAECSCLGNCATCSALPPPAMLSTNSMLSLV